MAENFSEQLDRALTAMIADPAAPLRVSAEIEPLLNLGRELRSLPRDEFKARLKEKLLRSMEMSEASATTKKAASYMREGFHTITPYLAVPQVMELIEFVKQAFDAKGEVYGIGSEGGYHSEYKIGDSFVMLGGGGNWRGEPKLTALHIYVDDVDASYQRAIGAGGKAMSPPIESHGERVASIQDPAGNEWYLAKRLSGSHTDEGLHTVNVYLHPVGASEMIEFLKRSFGAEEIISHRATPDGPVLHAKIKIGDSVLEMGEAHDRYQPLPSMLFLYVDDVDAWHRRALAGGATELQPPKDEFYGDRVSALTDPFGNTWYLATHIAEPGA
jgi:PhnB protein